MDLDPDTPFATKPALARVRAAGVPLTCVAGNTVYERAGSCGSGLDRRTSNYALNEVLWVGTGP